MNLTLWVWVVLGVFFILQGVVATYMIRSILRLRQTQHRIANHVQIISGQLQQRGLVIFPSAEDRAGGPTGAGSAR